MLGVAPVENRREEDRVHDVHDVRVLQPCRNEGDDGVVSEPCGAPELYMVTEGSAKCAIYERLGQMSYMNERLGQVSYMKGL